MKITEILDIQNNKQDFADVLKFESLGKIDTFIDNVLSISNNFNVPIDFLNHHIVGELLEGSREILEILVKEKFQPNSRWIINIELIIAYLSNV